MNLEELKKKEPELEDFQVNEMFVSIVMGKDVTDVINTKLGDFKIKYPKPKDLEEIGRRTAYRLNGIPAKCFDIDTYSLIQQIAALDVLVVEGPSWYEKAKMKNLNFGWKDIPSMELIQEVYAKAYSFRLEVQKKIDEDKIPENNRMDVDGSSNNIAQPGLFDGIESR